MNIHKNSRNLQPEETKYCECTSLKRIALIVIGCMERMISTGEPTLPLFSDQESTHTWGTHKDD